VAITMPMATASAMDKHDKHERDAEARSSDGR